VGRSDSYRYELLAHPGWSKGAARYDDGLVAHTHRRPALTDTSPKRSTSHRGRASPCPELRTLPPPALPVQRRHLPHRHTRYDAWGVPLQAEDPPAGNRFRYQSNWLALTDPTTLSLSPTRVCKATRGRFLQPDRIAYRTARRVYSYAESSPLLGSDPRGLLFIVNEGRTEGHTEELTGPPPLEALGYTQPEPRHPAPPNYACVPCPQVRCGEPYFRLDLQEPYFVRVRSWARNRRDPELIRERNEYVGWIQGDRRTGVPSVDQVFMATRDHENTRIGVWRWYHDAVIGMGRGSLGYCTSCCLLILDVLSQGERLLYSSERVQQEWLGPPRGDAVRPLPA
jgi:RHS repeat-associated protein